MCARLSHGSAPLNCLRAQIIESLVRFGFAVLALLWFSPGSWWLVVLALIGVVLTSRHIDHILKVTDKVDCCVLPMFLTRCACV